MRQENKVEKTITETVVTVMCDVCGKGITHVDKYHCCNCGKDLCIEHAEPEDGWTGDYPDYYCPDCYKRYRRYKEVEREYNDILEQKWQEIMKEGK